jgi:hypothetical protein
MRADLTRVAVGCVLVFLVLAAGLQAPAAEDVGGQDDASLRKGEARETLDPEMFSHPMVREAYQVARDIPWVLDSIYCYCFCNESPAFRHTSLLSCYVDLHASR